MGNLVLLDTGPLVALINRHDQFHGWADAQFREMQALDLVTCEAVIAESFFLLKQSPVGLNALLAYLDEGIVRLDFSLGVHVASVTPLMRKYRDIPMSLADACLVLMSELHGRARVFTLDADFKLYRRHGRHAIPLICPPS